VERKERAVVRRAMDVLGGRWVLLGVLGLVRGVDVREMVRQREREIDEEGDERRGRKVKEGGESNGLDARDGYESSGSTLQRCGWCPVGRGAGDGSGGLMDEVSNFCGIGGIGIERGSGCVHQNWTIACRNRERLWGGRMPHSHGHFSLWIGNCEYPKCWTGDHRSDVDEGSELVSKARRASRCARQGALVEN
jgi:hypothetical protein